jgi:predicted nucleic acid-binding protein
VKRVVVLDSCPLSFITGTQASTRNTDCTRWLRSLLAQGNKVVIPEIADYEVRRGYLRVPLLDGIANLNALKTVIDYIPLNTDVMLKAAEFWAQARRLGRNTGPEAALDGDVILAAQTALLTDLGDTIVIATTNVKHLEWFVDAQLWHEIT